MCDCETMLNTGLINAPTIFISRSYARVSADDLKIARRQFVLPYPYSNKDVNNYCVAVTFESEYDAVKKTLGHFVFALFTEMVMILAPIEPYGLI